MQKEPFAEDVLETMQFIASLLSQYLAAHSRCVNEWKERQEREERSRKTKERRARKLEQSPASIGTPTPSSGKPAPANEEEEEDSQPAVQGLVGMTCCPPYGYSTLYATYSTPTTPTGKFVELCFQGGAWEGDGIKMTHDLVTLEGRSYPFEWSTPPNIVIERDAVSICITA